MAGDDRFAELGRPNRVWAVAALNGDVPALSAMHDHLLRRVEPGDRIVYLGNYGGAGGSMVDVIDELLAFRRYLLAQPGFLASDIVYLRGARDEMWQKLLQIQFAPNPRDVLAWMMRQGIEPVLTSYGANAQEAYSATRDSSLTMTRWTNRLREAIRQRPGHEKFMTVLRRAAFTELSAGHASLFVHSGLDPDRPIGAQKDSFWWNYSGFRRLTDVYEGFTRVVRGADPEGGGVHIGDLTASLDGGAGSGGKLVAAMLDRTGTVRELIQT